MAAGVPLPVRNDLATVWKDVPYMIVVSTSFHGNIKSKEGTRAFARDYGIETSAAPIRATVTIFNGFRLAQDLRL